MSKVHKDTLDTAVAEIFRQATEKKRNFTETVELQISLKKYDPNKEKRFSGSIRLPHAPRPRLTVCVLGDAARCQQAAALGLPHQDLDFLRSLHKDKKKVKRFFKKYDSFVAPAEILRQLPRVVGSSVGRLGRFPALLAADEPLPERVNQLRRTVKFQLKKVSCLSLAIGHVAMEQSHVIENLILAINFLVSLLKRHWNNVGRLYIKSTMGHSHRIL